MTPIRVAIYFLCVVSAITRVFVCVALQLLAINKSCIFMQLLVYRMSIEWDGIQASIVVMNSPRHCSTGGMPTMMVS